MSNLASAPSVVFDIGANVGDTARSFLEYFPEATVYAFEPCAETFRQLDKNLAGYGRRARVHQLGFSSRTQVGQINLTSFHGANSLVEMSHDYAELHPQIQSLRQEEVELITIDEFVQRQGVEHVDLVKIDVEGFEREVLLGGRDTFRSRVDAVLVEVSLTRHGFGSDEWIKLASLLHDYGFDLGAVYDVGFERSPTHGLRLEQLDAAFGKRGKMLLR